MQNVNEQLREAIAQKDISAIRNILTTSMVQDPGFTKGVFESRLRRVLESGIAKQEIFEPFSGEEIIENKGLWTKDYYARARTDFRYNFSAERLEHLRRVGQKLYPAAPDEAAKKNTGTNPLREPALRTEKTRASPDGSFQPESLRQSPCCSGPFSEENNAGVFERLGKSIDNILRRIFG